MRRGRICSVHYCLSRFESLAMRTEHADTTLRVSLVTLLTRDSNRVQGVP